MSTIRNAMPAAFPHPDHPCADPPGHAGGPPTNIFVGDGPHPDRSALDALPAPGLSDDGNASGGEQLRRRAAGGGNAGLDGPATYGLRTPPSPSRCNSHP